MTPWIWTAVYWVDGWYIPLPACRHISICILSSPWSQCDWRTMGTTQCSQLAGSLTKIPFKRIWDQVSWNPHQMTWQWHANSGTVGNQISHLADQETKHRSAGRHKNAGPSELHWWRRGLEGIQVCSSNLSLRPRVIHSWVPRESPISS